MKNSINKFAGAFIILLISLSTQTSYAQIFQTRSEIVQDKGDNYTKGVTDDGVKYIIYNKEVTTSASGKYTQSKVFYFMKMNDGKELCFKTKLIEPSSETNSNVAYLKNKYVEVAYMQWKDYENSFIYDVSVEDGFCITTTWFDNKK